MCFTKILGDAAAWVYGIENGALWLEKYAFNLETGRVNKDPYGPFSLYPIMHVSWGTSTGVESATFSSSRPHVGSSHVAFKLVRGDEVVT